MSTYILRHDEANCIGCQACEVHCKTNKDLGPGPAPCKIIAIGPIDIGGRPRIRFAFMPCFHCEDAWCMRACPTGAMQKREKDGIVFVEHSLCIGCKSCMAACPWGTPQWDPAARKVVKCDYCKDRLDAGLQPACVTKCVTGCLSFGVVHRTARPPSRALRSPDSGRPAGRRIGRSHERTPDAAYVARRRRGRPVRCRAAGADPRRRDAGPRRRPVPDAAAAAAARAAIGPCRVCRRGRAGLSRLAPVPARPWTLGTGDRRNGPRREGPRIGHRARPRPVAAGGGPADRGRPARQPQGRTSPAARADGPRSGLPECR